MSSIEFRDLPLGTIFTIVGDVGHYKYVKTNTECTATKLDVSTTSTNAYCSYTKQCVCFDYNMCCVIHDYMDIHSVEFKDICRWCVLLDFERGVHKL